MIDNFNSEDIKIGVVGLGYVGLPLAIALKQHFNVIGFDISKKRIEQIQSYVDITGEISNEKLALIQLPVTNTITEIEHCNVYIVTVPTPIDDKQNPDLTALENASGALGNILKKGDIVVYESTVYPGVTEDICGVILESTSELKCGIDFFLGYSPERINPGDKVHTVEKITKIISGQNAEVVNKLQQIYGTMNNNNLFIAKNIKTAEAAKVIENTQRDINVAFINEVTAIVNKLGVSVYDVLEAANTKWNFLPFYPGLVGGHCIGVDPHYLAHCAKANGIDPKSILSGREINENMSKYIAYNVHEKLQKLGKQGAEADNSTANIKVNLDVNDNADKPKILILGLTFKENIRDLRNTKVVDLINELTKYGYWVDVHDPLVSVYEAYELYDIKLVDKEFKEIKEKYNCIIGAVAHQQYKKLTEADFANITTNKALLADIKHIWQHLQLPHNIKYFTL